MSSRCAVHFAYILSEFWNRDTHNFTKNVPTFEVAPSKIRKQASSQEPTSPDQVEPWPEEAKPKVEMPV
jgi:hypothetical protein